MRVEIKFEPRETEATLFIADEKGRMLPWFDISHGVVVHFELGTPVENIWFMARGGRLESYSQRRPT